MSRSKRNIEEKIVWSSKVISGLIMTQKILDLLHYRYSFVKSWKQLMLDLEKYLSRHPEKTPRDFKKFVLNCAKRHAQDIQSGKRFPDGKVNLKAFQGPLPTAPRDESLTTQLANNEIEALRDQLSKLERGTPEYEETLRKFKAANKDNQPVMTIGELFNKLGQMERNQ